MNAALHKPTGPSTAAIPRRASDPAKPEEPGSEDAPREGLRLPAIPSWAVSAVVHTVVLVVMAILPVATKADKSLLAVETSMETEVEEPDIDVPSIEESKPTEVESENPLDVQAIPDPGEATVGETLIEYLPISEAPTESFANPLDAFGKPDGKGAGLGDFGKGLGKGNGTFFKAQARGKKFAFIVDNSTSMRDGRFETARHELIKAIGKLEKDQSFYVILFSDTAYPLFWPQPAKEMVIASAKNKELLGTWLGTVELCSGTKGKKAIEQAMALKPDVVFLLGDGAFSDETIATANALNVVTPPKTSKVPIHVLGMEVNDIERQVLKQLSTENNGTYSDVELDPDIAKAAAANPIKLNRRRGAVWGVTLPLP